MTHTASDKIIMISGANRGIGKAIAEHLLTCGYRLSLGVRNRESLSDTVLANNKNVLVCYYDAVDKESAKAWVEKTANHFKRIDGLVNNAGIYRQVSIEEGDEEDLDTMWEVNAKGPWRLLRAAFPWLKKSGQARVINIISLSGKRLKSEQSTGYAMSKFAARALHQGCRQSGWDHGIRASALCTSFVKTDMASDVTSSLPEDITEPADVAHAVAFLLNQPNNAAINEFSINCRLEAEN
ncbi:SDR family NAD(P)-dependent oxidoreductase [Endozoicomonas sp. Mp262]|uniref:SDR family NAD(P)-dependent oxidoreductase n=1 Tax=Endozoicomonas sp. Mp262 TaxID=2919499 RepID=UPI0021DA5BFB